jgi:hypothetical protein
MTFPLVWLRWQGKTAHRDNKPVKEVWGRKSHKAGDQHHLIKYDTAVKDNRHGNGGLGNAKFAVETQQEQTAAYDGKFPDDEMIPERRDCPIRNGIQLRTSAIQDHVGEKGVENVQHDNPEQHREKSVPVTVDIAAPKPILSSAESASPTAEERIAAQHGCGSQAAIRMISHFHIQKDERHVLGLLYRKKSLFEIRGTSDFAVRKVKLPAHRAGLPGRERTKYECAP